MAYILAYFHFYSHFPHDILLEHPQFSSLTYSGGESLAVSGVDFLWARYSSHHPTDSDIALK